MISKSKTRIRHYERGITILDSVEQSAYNTYSPTIIGNPSYRLKLEKLIQDKPYNKFFNSLITWINSNKKLTLKQRQAIDTAYAEYLIKYS